ncbi:hypothetical protein Tdes44962_MAKER03903, partial [Teratosphaeria destructans]
AGGGTACGRGRGRLGRVVGGVGVLDRSRAGDGSTGGVRGRGEGLSRRGSSHGLRVLVTGTVGLLRRLLLVEQGWRVTGRSDGGGIAAHRRPETPRPSRQLVLLARLLGMRRLLRRPAPRSEDGRHIIQHTLASRPDRALLRHHTRGVTRDPRWPTTARRLLRSLGLAAAETLRRHERLIVVVVALVRRPVPDLGVGHAAEDLSVQLGVVLRDLVPYVVVEVQAERIRHAILMDDRPPHTGDHRVDCLGTRLRQPAHERRTSYIRIVLRGEFRQLRPHRQPQLYRVQSFHRPRRSCRQIELLLRTLTPALAQLFFLTPQPLDIRRILVKHDLVTLSIHVRVSETDHACSLDSSHVVITIAIDIEIHITLLLRLVLQLLILLGPTSTWTRRRRIIRRRSLCGPAPTISRNGIVCATLLLAHVSIGE